MADPKAPSKPGSSKVAPETATTDSTPEATETATSPSGHWRFTGEYAAIYLPPDRVSRWIQSAEAVNWGPGGPPDGHWEPTDAPVEPAPSVSTDDTKKE